MTTLPGDYEPSPSDWVNDQVAEYEASGGQKANTLLDTGMPIVVVTTRGAKSGKVRKTPVMRVESATVSTPLVASKGGAPEHPEWFHNLVAHPDEVLVQDGPAPVAVSVREVSGDEKAAWWERAGRRLSALRRVPGEDRPADPGLRHDAQGGLIPRSRWVLAGVAKASIIAARHGTRHSSRSWAVLPSRTTSRSSAGRS